MVLARARKEGGGKRGPAVQGSPQEAEYARRKNKGGERAGSQPVAAKKRRYQKA